MLRRVAIRLGLLGVGLALAVLGVETLARLAPGLLLPGAVRTPLELKALERRASRELKEAYGAKQPYRLHEEEPAFRSGLPNIRYQHHGLDYSATIEYGSLGIRDRDPRPDDPPVALLLGDSFVEARQHAAEGTPSALLQGLLAERGQDWWVVNAGIGATGTTNQLHLFEWLAPQLRPRLAILLLFPTNDLVNNSLPFQAYETLSSRKLGVDLDGLPLGSWRPELRETRRGYYRPGPDAGLVYLPRLTPLQRALARGERERFVELLRQARREIVACREDLRRRGPVADLARRLAPHAYATLAYRLGAVPSLRCRPRLEGVPMELVFASAKMREAYPEWIEESWQVTERMLARLAREAAALDCPLVLAVLPHSIEVDPERRALLLDAAPADARVGSGETPVERALRMGRALGLPTLDLAAAFRAHGDPASLYLPLDPHLSAAGVEVLARQLLAAFEAAPPAAAPPGGV